MKFAEQVNEFDSLMVFAQCINCDRNMKMKTGERNRKHNRALTYAHLRLEIVSVCRS